MSGNSSPTLDPTASPSGDWHSRSRRTTDEPELQTPSLGVEPQSEPLDHKLRPRRLYYPLDSLGHAVQRAERADVGLGISGEGSRSVSASMVTSNSHERLQAALSGNPSSTFTFPPRHSSSVAPASHPPAIPTPPPPTPTPPPSAPPASTDTLAAIFARISALEAQNQAQGAMLVQVKGNLAKTQDNLAKTEGNLAKVAGDLATERADNAAFRNQFPAAEDARKARQLEAQRVQDRKTEARADAGRAARTLYFTAIADQAKAEGQAKTEARAAKALEKQHLEWKARARQVTQSSTGSALAGMFV